VALEEAICILWPRGYSLLALQVRCMEQEGVGAASKQVFYEITAAAAATALCTCGTAVLGHGQDHSSSSSSSSRDVGWNL
jgi:hypothetical protein